MKKCSNPFLSGTRKQSFFYSLLGFTLLEILIALFIFTLISMMMMSGLHSVIKAQTSTEMHAVRLREIQLALLICSRDIQQTVNRPITNVNGQEEAAFIGSTREFTFTHLGNANETTVIARSSLQRTRYIYEESSLVRLNWPVLDLAPTSQPVARQLLTNVSALTFEYLDNAGQFHANWPIDGDNRQAVPRAIKITAILSDWGALSQLYVIPLQPSSAEQTPQKS